MTLSKQSVTVVGAGPAGLTAALVLARNGYTVNVYEAHTEVGRRFHGDFQGLENWSIWEDVPTFLERLGMETNFLCVPYTRVEVYDDQRNRTVLEADEPLFYLVRRGPVAGSLDRGLKSQAEAAGATFHFGQRLERVTPPAIVATGPHAAEAIAVGLLFQTDLEDMAVAIVDDNLAPKGYAYLLVHQGQATLATVLFRWFRREREYLDRTIQAFTQLYRPTMKDAREFGGFGNWYLTPRPGAHDKWYMGEAAGLQDGFLGFGLRYAITSGYLAARSFLNGVPYHQAVKKFLHPWMRTSLVNRFLYERLNHRGYRRWIRRLGRMSSIRAWMHKQYRPTWWKTMIYPMAYLIYAYRRRYRDWSCSHEACTCVWCRCEKPVTP